MYIAFEVSDEDTLKQVEALKKYYATLGIKGISTKQLFYKVINDMFNSVVSKKGKK